MECSLKENVQVYLQ